MRTIIIKAKKDSDANIMLQLAKKIGISSYELTEKEKEDIALKRAIDEAMREKSLPVQKAYAVLNHILEK